MAAIYSNGGNRWNILGFNFTKRDAIYIIYLWLILFMRLITLPSRTNKNKTVPIDHWLHMDGLCMLGILISVWNVQTNLRCHRH